MSIKDKIRQATRVIRGARFEPNAEQKRAAEAAQIRQELGLGPSREGKSPARGPEWASMEARHEELGDYFRGVASGEPEAPDHAARMAEWYGALDGHAEAEEVGADEAAEREAMTGEYAAHETGGRAVGEIVADYNAGRIDRRGMEAETWGRFQDVGEAQYSREEGEAPAVEWTSEDANRIERQMEAEEYATAQDDGRELSDEELEHAARVAKGEYDQPHWAGPTEEHPTVQAWADAHPDQVGHGYGAEYEARREELAAYFRAVGNGEPEAPDHAQKVAEWYWPEPRSPEVEAALVGNDGPLAGSPKHAAEELADYQVAQERQRAGLPARDSYEREIYALEAGELEDADRIEAEQERQDLETLHRDPDWADLSEEARLEYLGGRAAEMASDNDATFDAARARMARDGVPGEQRWQVLDTAMTWRSNEATAEASGGFMGAPVPEEPSRGEVDADKYGPYPTRELRAREAGGWRFGDLDEEELEPGTDPENADQAMINTPDPASGFMGAPVPEEEAADPLRGAWIEASDRYDELLSQQDADPDAPLGERIKGAYYARQDAFEAMHESAPPPEAADLTDAQVDADNAGRRAQPWAEIQADREAGQ